MHLNKECGLQCGLDPLTPPEHVPPCARRATYTYPVLTSDRSSFALTRSDPRSCKYDNEMVLLWKRGVGADNQAVSGHYDLDRLTIEEVFEKFEDMAKELCDNMTSYYRVQGRDSEPHNLHNEKVKDHSKIDAFSLRVSKIQSPNKNLNTNSFDNSISKETYPACDLLRGKLCDYNKRSERDANFTCGSYDDSSSVGDCGDDEYIDVCDDDNNEDDDEVFVDVTGLNSGNRAKSLDQSVIHVPVTLIQCHNPSCQRISPAELARRCFKNCHSCLVAYCGRHCRKRDWERHKTVSCYGSLVISACKRVIRFCNKNWAVKDILSRIARRGFISLGRGCVMLGFPCVSAALEFMESGLSSLQLKLVYIRAQDLKLELLKSQPVCNNNKRLVDMCYSYNPEMKFVLNVGVGSSSFSQDDHCIYSSQKSRSSRIRSLSFESDGGYGSISSFSNAKPKDASHITSSDTRHTSGDVTQRCIKLRLTPLRPHSSDLEKDSQLVSPYGPTLIISGVPGLSLDRAARKMRDLTFVNVQRKLRERGVNLKDQFPAVYNSLIQFVTRGRHFPSQIIYPRDSRSGKLFMCVLMPECEPDLEWTQSLGMLDDLDLSERGIWRSAPMTRFMLAEQLQDMDGNVTYPCVKTESTISCDIKYPLNNVTAHISCDCLESRKKCCTTAQEADVASTGESNVSARYERKINRVPNPDVQNHPVISHNLPDEAHSSTDCTSDHQNSLLSPRFKSKQNKRPECSHLNLNRTNSQNVVI